MLPYLQREWLYHYSDIVDDRLDELFWAFTSNKRFENIVKLLDQEDKSNLLSWMKYLLLEKQGQVFVNSNIDELNGFIAFLEKDIENQPHFFSELGSEKSFFWLCSKLKHEVHNHKKSAP